LAWSDRPSGPFTLNVQLTAQDYAQYFALANKRQSTWANALVFLIAFSAAILVALSFRFLASLETSYPAAIELTGRYSLFAYLVGVFAMLLASWIMRRRSIASALSGTPNAFAPKTVVIDADTVSMSGELSEVRWSWPSFTQFTVARGLLCLWIGSQSAVIIPERAFASVDTRNSAIAFIKSKLDAVKAPA
jgi:hypothetical protein